ncbi:MAG: hypothetical protein V7719_01965 [Psychroserpens sp.]|uniref:hypothetical protein n=1 Tax=Psychroserpens sp. TaxID=2020870 RepID=UPI003002591D
MKTKERTIAVILFGWSVVHGFLYFKSNGYYSRNYFWPFDKEPSFYSQYNFDEFFAYAVVPWLAFLFYKLLYRYFKI